MSELTSDKKYDSILKIIDDHLLPDTEAKKQRGEVFTPPQLIREMLFGLKKSSLDKGKNEIWGLDDKGNFIDDKESDRIGGIPSNVWQNPESTFLDPANGIGNFPVIAFYKLDYELKKQPKFRDANKRKKHIIEKMLYMIEIDKGNCQTCKAIFRKICPEAKPNICCQNSLTITNDKLEKNFGINTFDVVIGNPPFNPPKTETGSSGNTIWQNFVIKYFYTLNDKGYLCFVHPPGWKKPTDETFKPERFASGDYTGQIRQGQVWKVLKQYGIFKFIYTNDMKSKLPNLVLPHFPAVDYYVYQKGGDKSDCDTKNIFLGNITISNDVKLNYNLKYLPNLITKQTQDILYKITSKDGDKTEFKAGFDPRGFKSKEKGSVKYMYDSSINGPNYSLYKEKIPNVDISKVVLNENGGINGFYCKFIDKSEHIGVLHHTLLFPVEKTKGKNIEKFFNSDLIKFIFLITQYTSGKMTTNEKLVANSISIPPDNIIDYYAYFGIEKYKKYIEDNLRHYEQFKAPKRSVKTEKAKKGGYYNKTRKNKKN